MKFTLTATIHTANIVGADKIADKAAAELNKHWPDRHLAGKWSRKEDSMELVFQLDNEPGIQQEGAVRDSLGVLSHIVPVLLESLILNIMNQEDIRIAPSVTCSLHVH